MHRAGLVQAPVSLVLQETAESCRQMIEIQSSVAYGPVGSRLRLVSAHPWPILFGLFGKRVFADDALPSRRHNPTVFLFKIIVTRPQGSDLT